MPAGDYTDVLIVGAGLSGIGAACHLQAEAPGVSYAIVEARERSGGTWDLFRYPGVRSDSDMFTLGYTFRPWTGTQAIAGGQAILRYLRQTAAEHGVDDKISYNSRVVAAGFSTPDARWTVLIEDPRTGQRTTRSCGFLFLCAGYYSYERGYTPRWPGQESFAGQIVHPQSWPDGLDVTGKHVVVIGSGATAITLVPALAKTAARVTMLQRSPSYVVSLPARDPVGDLLLRWLPPRRAYQAIRWKNARIEMAIYTFCRRYPAKSRELLRRAAARQLPPGFDLDTHFTPAYEPWDQRMCLAPGGDFFAAIRSGRAEIVTGHIEEFTRAGLRLRSGAELPADLVVTATGLNLLPLGGAELTVDGEPVRVGERVAYKAMMLDSVPNMAFAIGYTNASWTLKIDLVCSYVARMVAYMRRSGHAIVTPRLPPGTRRTPLVEMTSGYFQRALGSLPQQGDRAPWRLRQHYFKDAALYREPVTAAGLEYRRAREVRHTAA
jgi:monooxygenase